MDSAFARWPTSSTRLIAGFGGWRQRAAQASVRRDLRGVRRAGAAGERAFNGAGTGINFPVWYAALVIASVLTMKQAGGSLHFGRISLLALGLACSILVLWRGSESLLGFCVLAAGGCVTLAPRCDPQTATAVLASSSWHSR